MGVSPAKLLYACGWCRSHISLSAVPFSKLEVSLQKPRKQGYPENPQTLGEHIKKRRLDLKLFQEDVAKIIGVSVSTIHSWETNRSLPYKFRLTKIIKFLGYKPTIKSKAET